MMVVAKKGIVTARIAPLYVRADVDSSLADEVLHGMVVSVLEDGGEPFVRVRTHYGYEGYARRCDFLLDDERTAQWELVEKNTIFYAAVDVLNAPAIQASRIGLLTRGCRVIRLRDEPDGWARVRLADGAIGFVRTKHTGKIVKKLTIQDLKNMHAAESQSFRQSLTETAMAYLHMETQYRWGGKSPEGIDCSGLCSMVYMLNGVLIGRDARMEEMFPVKQLTDKPNAMLQGDLLYFPGHIAMSLGGDRFIHSTARSDGVCINSLNRADADFRGDLAESLVAVGRVFANYTHEV